MSQWDLLEVFGTAMLLGAIAAPTLALAGSQLLAKSEELHSLCILQGLSLAHTLFGRLDDWLAILSIVCLSVVFSLLLDRLPLKAGRKKPGLLLAIYLIFLSATFLSLSLFPSGDLNGLKTIFGDLVTLSQRSILFLIPIFSVFLMYFWFTYKKESHKIFQKQLRSVRIRSDLHLVMVGTTIGLVVHFLGGLFAMTFMVIAPALIGLLRGKGLLRFQVHLGLLSSFAAVSGFIISLLRTDLPTTPAITLCLAASVMLILFFQSMYRYFFRKESV